MQRRHALALCLVLLGLLVACTPKKGSKTRDVSRTEYGDRWPLTVDEDILACEPGGVPTVTVDGCSYGLDSADEEERRPTHRLERILANDSEGRHNDATVLLRDALALSE